MSVPKDIGYGLDDFQRMKVYTEAESIARYILNILLMRPGNYPGLPHIGLNVRQLLYDNLETFDATALKEQIYTQCGEIMPNIISNEIFAGVIEYNGITFLLIRIPVEVDSTSKVINYAFYENDLREIKFDFEIEDDSEK